jgi:uncharacterized membrane protein YozB (DUF420 family)
MARFPVIVYVSQLWLFLTFVLGLFIIARGLGKSEKPEFSVRRHKRIGRLFLAMVLFGALLGKFVTASLPLGTLRMPGSTFLAVLTVVLAIVGEVFGYQGERKRLRVRTGTMQMHPWFFITVTALVFAQLILGLRALRIIKF